MPRTPTTRWSMVAAAGGGGGDALEALCRAYRPVVLAHLRRHGDPAAAEDATQAFFLHLIEHDLPARADRARGSFRAFLFTAVENHRRQQRRGAQALKRAGGADAGDEALAHLADTGADPAKQFDRDWAWLVLERGRERLQAEALRAGKAELFQALLPFLGDSPERDDYATIAARFGMPANSVAVSVKRLRERLRALVRRELADTLAAGADLDAELRWLRAALRD